MATLSEMQAYVAKRLIDPNNQSVSTDDITGAINDAIKLYKKRRLFFNEARTDNFLTAQNENITLPSNYYLPVSDRDGFSIYYGEVRYTLTKISAEQYDAWFVGNGYGLPRYYAKVGNGYKLWPIPDQDYQITARYLKQYTALSAPDSENDFSINAPDLIQSEALANLSGELRQDEKMETYYRNKSNRRLKELETEASKANATGSLEINSYL